jgi:ABC-2 type transport system permease protein
MAVYKRTFTSYEGALTPVPGRFMILPKYAFRTVLESKLLTAFLTLCFIPHLIALVLIYLRNNVAALELLAPEAAQQFEFLPIDGVFFLSLFRAQSFLSFFLVSLIGPGLISPDLANNALPLYLSRPFSRSEYVLGKLAVLLSFASVLTWIPGLLLIGFQTSFAGFEWLGENMGLAAGIVAGSWIWMLTISLLSLALSAWVRFKPIASAALFGVFFIGAGFGEVINEILNLQPEWGTLLNMAWTMTLVWRWLLLGTAAMGGLPAWAALVAMLTVCALSLLLLEKKIRACEVVR